MNYKKNHYDVIHFNTGLWDVVRLSNESKRCFISCDEYIDNIRRIISRLRFYWESAQIIFATTTSVVEPCKVVADGDTVLGYRYNSGISRYNKAVTEMINSIDDMVWIDDLYSASLKLDDERMDKTHFSSAGYKILAESVIRSISSCLF